MDIAAGRKERLGRLLDLAQTYRGWTRKDLARSLRRDPTKLIPGSGLPKLDLVVDLSQVLDWPIEMVVEALWSGDLGGLSGQPVAEPEPDDCYVELDAAARTAHRDGRYTDLIELARRAYAVAETPYERAKACNRECGGWDGLGRYNQVLEAVQRGLREPGVPSDTRLMLRANLANAYYTLWQLVESKATARDLIDQFEEEPADGRLQEVVAAFAHYVRGQSRRRMIEMEPDRAAVHARAARADLEHARSGYIGLAARFDDDSYLGVANTCAGGLLELEAALGVRPVEAVLQDFAEGIDPLTDPADFPSGDLLESYGWWCIFACNTALRHVTDEKALQQHMAVFTNKADEIANHTDNWSMRERVFTMEFARRQRLTDWTGFEPDWTIDRDDVRVIAGTMGRFPAFQRTGWRILGSAKVIRDN